MTHYEYPDNFYRERASSVLAKYANAIATFLAPNSHWRKMKARFLS